MTLHPQRIKCLHCNTYFESKRAEAKYCSARCRMRVMRSVTDKLSVTKKDKSVTDNQDFVTDNETDNKVYAQRVYVTDKLDVTLVTDNELNVTDKAPKIRGLYFSPALEKLTVNDVVINKLYTTKKLYACGCKLGVLKVCKVHQRA